MKYVWLVVLLGFAEASHAFRCGNQLVAEGDTRYEVKAICGVPDDATKRTYYRSISNNAVIDCDPVRRHTVSSLGTSPGNVGGNTARSCLALVEDKVAVRIDVDVWLFDFGKNRFMQQVHFENGHVVHIEKLGYGVKPRR